MFLESGTFYRLGGAKEIKKDARIIATSNKCLSEEMKEGQFRRDLFYRISTIDLYIRPLRERKEDIPLLVENILKKENNENGMDKKINQKALNILLHHRYPGNIRELENIIKKSYAFSNADEIREKDIEFEPQVHGGSAPKQYSRGMLSLQNFAH